MLVGDPKQALYRWRGGKAEQFIDLAKEDKKHNPFPNKDKETLRLGTNYRSFSEVIQFNNAFFKQLADKFENPDYKNLYENLSHQDINSKMGGYVNLSFIGSGVDMNDKLILYDNAPEYDDFVQTNKNTFNALGIYTDPSLYARYMFSKRFGIELNVGGAISFSTPLYFDKVKNYITVYDEKRFVNWSGVRLSVGIVCKL